MSTLTTALHYAVSGLSVSSAQSALASRNVAFAQDPGYSRRTAQLITLPGGGAAVGMWTRSADKLLLDKLLAATSLAAGAQVASSAFLQLSAIVGDPEADSSVGALVGKLQTSLAGLEANPSSMALASGAVQSAQDLAVAINGASAAVQSMREQADHDMSDSVGRINNLLSQFKVANDAVIRGTGTADELSDNLDERDRILKLLAEETGIRTVTRSNNDIAIYTEGGVTLFEGIPRKVEFTPTQPMTAGALGNSVMVDGVAIVGGPSPMPARHGRLAGLAVLRDSVGITVQTQLDEIARGLIEIFSEQEQTAAPSLPDAAGLFTDGNSAAIPAAGLQSLGLAGRIRVNPLALPSAGGNPFLLRDGGFGGATFVYNPTGAASFQGRLAELQGAFDSPRAFLQQAQIGTSLDIKSFSFGSAGWIEAQRQGAETTMQSAAAMRLRTSESLLRITGVNIDEEMASILDLERSYQASAKVLTTIDQMLASLMAAIG